MNDQHDDRHRGAEPQWPTGEDPDARLAPRRGAGDQPDRPNTPPGGFERQPRHGTPPGGFARPPAGGPPQGTPPGGIPRGGGAPPGGVPRATPPGGAPHGTPGTPPGGVPRGGGTPPDGIPRSGGTPPGGIPQPGGRRHAPDGDNGYGRPPADGPGRGGPGGPRPVGGPGAPSAANADPNATRHVPRGPGRPTTPPGGVRRPGGAPGPGVPGAGLPGPGGTRRPGEEPTDLLPPVHQTVAREPELLTHREDEIELEPFYDDEYDEELTPEEEKALRRKKIWRRVRRVSYVGLFLMILGPIVAFAIAYQLVEVPNPEQVAADQIKAVTILYSDGTEMSKIAPSGGNRTLVKYEEVPDTVKKAIFAAEDPTFETNPGFDFRAIARAGWYQVTGRKSGGSGLTQQYVKKASDQDDETLTRKFTEVVKAYKMSEQQDKKEILTAYLNTIYFGRSAYGIKEAANVYFGKPLDQLTQSEAALIAGMIQNPSRSEEKAYVQERWDYVMGQLLRWNWITQADKDQEQFPAPRPLSEVQSGGLDGPRLLIQNQIIAEMAEEGWPMTRAHQSGVVVHTTIDPKMQTAAEDAVREVMEGEPKELKQSLTAIDPNTGAVKAYYAGADGNGIDYARGTIQEAGSSFKPFDVVAALHRGKGLGSTYDGVSPKTFPGGPGPADDVVIRNATDRSNSCGKQCPIREAMRMSLNTVFYDMVANELGTQAVANAAFEAGIPRVVPIEGKDRQLLVGENGGPPGTGIAIGGGEAQVRPFDMAVAYASFASRGTYHKPFFVSKITNAEGQNVHTHVDTSRVAFGDDPEKSRDIADNITESLKPVLPFSNLSCAGGRECAGKTGTHELPDSVNQNSKAWMVGYTPSLSVSVWMGRNEGNKPLLNAKNESIFGSGLPGQIWKKFMDKALEGTPMEKFPKAKPMGQYESPKSPVNPTTTTPKDEDGGDRTTTGRPTTTRDEPTTTTTKPTKPSCGGLFPACPTTTTQPNEPDPIGGGSPPTR